MNIPYLSWRSLITRPLSSLLSWLLLAFGVTVVVLILLISDQLKKEISSNAKGIDLVVGAKGSPLQIILANIFHIDFPTGNIDLKLAAKISKNRYIASSIPLSLGDSYAGYRIVGTTKAYADLYGAELRSGEWFGGHMEAVLGAEVAEKLGLNTGQYFESQHGLSEDGDSHEGSGFLVSGVMKRTNTVADRLILTSVPAIWEVHSHDEDDASHQSDTMVVIEQLGLTVSKEQLENEQITSLLISYRSPMGAVMLPRSINEERGLQAASPAYETARLFNIIGVGVRVVNILGVLIIAISAVSVFIALLNSLKDRKFDIAIMRSMGARRRQIFSLILIEGLIITFVGAISGVIFAHLIIGLLGTQLEGAKMDAFYFLSLEWFVVIGCLLIGALASAIPAILAYRADISSTLSKV